MKPQDEYIISGGSEGKTRLNVLAEVMYPYTRSLLEQLGLTAGMSFLDAGCGGGHVARMAAEMAGEQGQVTAVDFDEEIISLNRQEADASGFTNIRYRVASAYDLGHNREFDIAYARFLLSHLTDPLAVVRGMSEAVKAGGVVAVEDIQFSGHFSYPSCPAFDDYVSLFKEAASARRQNADIGPELPSLLKQAGLSAIQFDVIQPVFSKGAGKWMAYITMEKIRDAVLSQQLADDAGIRRILDELKTFTEDEQTILSLPRIFRAWGVRQ